MKTLYRRKEEFSKKSFLKYIVTNSSGFHIKFNSIYELIGADTFILGSDVDTKIYDKVFSYNEEIELKTFFKDNYHEELNLILVKNKGYDPEYRGLHPSFDIERHYQYSLLKRAESTSLISFNDFSDVFDPHKIERYSQRTHVTMCDYELIDAFVNISHLREYVRNNMPEELI